MTCNVPRVLCPRDIWLPHTHVQGVKQSVYPSVVVVVIVVVSTKITRSRVLGICACCKHNQSVDIGEKLVCTHFAQKGLLVLRIVHYLFSMPVVYRPHPLHGQVLMRLRILKLSVGKGRQVIKQLCDGVLQYYTIVATERSIMC